MKAVKRTACLNAEFKEIFSLSEFHTQGELKAVRQWLNFYFS